jgi:AraC-like DNA-binding protein
MSPIRMPLRETRFANERLDPIGVELMSLAALRARVPGPRLFEAERVAFYVVVVVTSGSGEHLVDFERYALGVGHAIFVRPGQVQQWQPANGLKADVLLIDPAVVRPNASMHRHMTLPLLRQEDWPAHFTLSADGMTAWRALAALLRKELDQPLLNEVSAALAHELLGCLMLNISRSATQRETAPAAQTVLIRRLRRALEERIHARPDVATLARELRVSSSTLTRTCRAVLGHSAKAEVDRCVALEAQRLLVHSTLTSVAIGELLGFDEPTNFVKFFRRRVGTTPQAFRQAHRFRS